MTNQKQYNLDELEVIYKDLDEQGFKSTKDTYSDEGGYYHEYYQNDTKEAFINLDINRVSEINHSRSASLSIVFYRK